MTQDETSAGAWLSTNVAQYDLIDDRGRNAIFEFVMIWSLLENRRVKAWNETNETSNLSQTLNPRVIKEMAPTLDQEETVSIISEVFDYFVQRYVVGNEHSMCALSFQTEADKKLVEGALLNSRCGPAEKAEAVFLIINRLRNNLLHGEKWDSGLGDQTDNFECSTRAMLACLEKLPR